MINWQDKETYVVLKFQYGKRGTANPIVSQTMGRLAVISHAYEGSMPQPRSFWLCRIEKELGSGMNGCFVVIPVKEVPIAQIMKLVPGMYEQEIVGSTVVCRPKVEGHYWIIPFSLKKYFIKKGKAETLYQSVVVPLQVTASA